MKEKWGEKIKIKERQCVCWENHPISSACVWQYTKKQLI